MADNRKRIAVIVVFILFSLTAVLSMALDVFMVLRLELKTSQEMLIAHATLRWNEFICRTKQKGSLQRKARAYWKKKTGGFLSRYVSAVLKHMRKRIVPPATVFIIFILQLTGALLRLLSSHQLDIINFQTKWTPPCILCNSFDCFHTFWVFTVVEL